MTMGFIRTVSKNILFSTGVLCAVSAATSVQAQSNIEVFGQNRKQDRKFDWKFFDTRHFRVYHYDKAGRQLGRYVAEEAEYDVAIIEKKMGGQFPPRFNIILYNSYDEYRQTNVGLKEESPLIGNTRAGSIKVVDDKLVVYFTGSHTDLRRQIRSGMAMVMMQRMIYGDNLKKMVKNALTLSLPEWVTEGYIAYLVDGWDQQSNSEWKGLLDARPKAGFHELAEENPELGGKAFWKFVSNQYGNGTVKSLLYSMQQKTGLDKAMRDPTNLNMSVAAAYDSCIRYYKNVFARDAARQDKPDSTNGAVAIKVPKDNSVVKNILVSPNGTHVSFVAWHNGEFKVCTQQVGGNQNVNVLLEGGKKDLTEQLDPNYPMLAWSSTGSKLAMLYRKGKQVRLRVYNNTKGREENYVIPANRFDRPLSMAFSVEDDKLIFSAIKKSQTDLYMFTMKGSKITNITDDVWDDLSPVFISGGARTGILFLSNRPKPNLNVPVGVNELPAGPMNVFFYNTVTQRTELLQCSRVTKGKISQPIQYGTEHFAYLLDSSGINNRYVVQFARDSRNEDSAYALPVTNYNTSIISHKYNATTADVADVVQVKDKYVVYYHDLVMPGDSGGMKYPVPTILSSERPDPVVPKAGSTARKPASAAPAPAAAQFPGRYAIDEPTKPEIKGGNVFQSEFTDNEEQPKQKVRQQPTTTEEELLAEEQIAVATAADSSVLTEISDSAYLKMKPTTYRRSFKPDFLSVKLDNSILLNQYQSVNTNGGQFANNSLGALTMMSLNELMEDQRITGGFQLPYDAAYSAWFMQYQNSRRRLDWGLLFLRKQNKETKNVAYIDQNGNLITVLPQVFRTVSNIIQADLSWPFDRMRSLRFHTAVREDNFVQKVTDTISLILDFPKAEYFTSMSRVEYVFDNTISPVTNIMYGTRYKVYGEYMYGLNAGNKSCYNFGLDFRNYQKLYKTLILANRLAYAHSDGNGMVQYLLGGVDNWMRPKVDGNAFQSPGENFAFQTLSTSLRGYKQNARTGNNFAVLSTEVRLPIAATFIKFPVKSSILRNLQVVSFLDAGTAWDRFLPTKANMSPSATFPTIPSKQGPNNVFVTISVPYGNALTAGYGAGLRTALYGYYIRMDVAKSVEAQSKPIVYFALGTDF